jgi:putative hydrolase of the HAD superfamily
MVPYGEREASSLGWSLSVASSSPREWVTGHLARVGILEAFDVLACGDEVLQHKPHPDVYLLALERLHVPPSAAVAIEDTPHGVAAAKSAGIRCIAIPNAFSQREWFGHADHVLTSAETVSLARLVDDY